MTVQAGSHLPCQADLGSWTASQRARSVPPLALGKGRDSIPPPGYRREEGPRSGAGRMLLAGAKQRVFKATRFQAALQKAAA